MYLPLQLRPNINCYLLNVLLPNRRQFSVEVLINNGILVNVSVSLLNSKIVMDIVTVCWVPFLLLLNWFKFSFSC